jgi:class 3 adenylate cyclase/tetratricopeptide (TPR) repeat protein
MPVRDRRVPRMGGDEHNQPMREERKVVTALFADVVGSTQLTERLDPEDAREVLGDAVRRMVEAVEAFGGTVKDLAGDGILALFGAPVTHEDDAERAIRAGLRIVRDAQDSEPSLSVRVGIETGLVVLGPVGGGSRVEYGATGDALNTAARLQSQASPAAVLVGDVTRRAAGERFAWGEELRLELKGKSEVVSAFKVVGERRGPSVVAAAAPMVGRERELERASRIAERALGGEGGVILVVGEPGIGKSRLVEEVHRSVSRPVLAWLEGRCVSYGESTPYLPLRDLIHDALELPRDESADEPAVRQHVRELGEGLDDTVPYLAAMLDVAGDGGTRHLSPETLRLRTLEALRRLVLALAERGPVVVAIEDLHWADASTLQALERLVAASEGVPLLFVLTTRGVDGAAPALVLPAAGPSAETIELAPLPRDRLDELVDALLEGEEIPADLLRRVVETAGGNPFFLSELVRSLVGSGLLARGGETWVVADRGASVELPTTIEKVILARLDTLEASARDVLTAASVLGRTVTLPVLERLVGSDPRAEADELVRARLFERDGRPDEVWFAHALIQEVAYGSLLKRRRRELHASAAAAIEGLWPDRVEEHLGTLARHHRGAGDLEAARRCHDLAAERAERLHAGEEALEHLTASIELAAELGRTVADPEVAERVLARARVRARTGDAAGARADLEAILATVDAEAERRLAMRAHDELGFVLAGAADYRAAVPYLEAALATATALGDAAAEVSALSRLSIVHANRLDFDAALRHGERALHSAEASGDERAEATAMDALKQVALETGDFETLERVAGRLTEIHRRNDDLWLLQFAVFEVAYADVARVRLDRAFAGLEETLSISRRIGDVGNEPLYVAMLGRVHRARAEYDEALTLGRRSFDLAVELGHGEWTAWTAAWLGATLLEVGSLDEAARILSAGAEAAERTAADLHLVRCFGLHAWTALRSGDGDRAVELADRATAILDRIRVRPPRAYVAGQDAYVGVAQVRLARGEPDAAVELVGPIVQACRDCGWSDGVVEGSLVLAEVALRRGDAAAAVEAAGSAVAEALRTGLPTAWRAHRAMAEAFRAAGDEEGAASHAAQAGRAVARVRDGIHDRSIREAFESAVAGGPFSEGDGRWR